MTSPHRSFPKEGEKKLKDTIKKLKAENRQLKKENDILRDEVKNIMKPIRTRKAEQKPKRLTDQEWRQNFVDEFKKSLKEREDKEGIDLCIK